MKNMNLIKLGLMALVIGFLSVATAADASAQGGMQSRANVEAVIRRMEEASNEFRSDFRNELDRSNLNNSQKNTYRRQVDAFEQATDRLRSNFDRDNNWQRSRSQVQNVIRSAQPLNNTMNSISFRRNIERQWNQLRNNVNTLANTYGLPGIAGGSWNGGGNQPGGPGWGGGQAGAMRPPNWAQGTFYGVAPNGSQISLTIDGNGRVTANVNGGLSYGVYTRGNVLNIAGSTSRVTRQGNGILTTSTTDGERIAYSRTSGGNPGNPGWGGGGNGNPPNWAVGRFRASSPQGGTIFMTVARDGNVTVNMGGNVLYGTLRGTMLSIDGNTAQVQQDRNGFRTVSTLDGQTIVYRRN